MTARVEENAGMKRRTLVAALAIAFLFGGSVALILALTSPRPMTEPPDVSAPVDPPIAVAPIAPPVAAEPSPPWIPEDEGQPVPAPGQQR